MSVRVYIYGICMYTSMYTRVPFVSYQIYSLLMLTILCMLHAMFLLKLESMHWFYVS